MTLTTKILIAVLFIGASVNSLYYNNYKDAFHLLLEIIMILVVWYYERIKLNK